MVREEDKAIINHYVAAYNSFDVAGMVKFLHNDIIFRNVSNGEINTETRGIQEFIQLAEKSSQMFSSRCQTIMSYDAVEDKVEVQIDYEGTLAVDLPNGLGAGDKIQLKGKSIIAMVEGKIYMIEDYS
ncbi:nuclear transport factor 2 family protein [Paenibacillus sp. MCAF9]|uniref:nuclear transport factor 2 family protein n=1 Tax=Paenibacillus sp. MCAF9 TaxID=3233046 RepID=UPI003F9C6DF2